MKNLFTWGMAMNYRVIAYAADFVSFFIQHADMDNVRSIILFGSVARGNPTKNSDVDIFIDSPSKRVEKKVQQLIKRFHASVKVTQYWKLLGVQNEIKCIVGQLSQWKDLQRSIISNGIILYGGYTQRFKGSTYALFTVSMNKPRAQSVKLWRKLYGYTQKVGKKTYQTAGVVADCEGKKLSRGTFLIPLQHSNKVIAFLKKQKIRHTIMELTTDADSR
jgi:predicted nucleotidyltransferase